MTHGSEGHPTKRPPEALGQAGPRAFRPLIAWPERRSEALIEWNVDGEDKRAAQAKVTSTAVLRAPGPRMRGRQSLVVTARLAVDPARRMRLLALVQAPERPLRASNCCERGFGYVLALRTEPFLGRRLLDHIRNFILNAETPR